MREREKDVKDDEDERKRKMMRPVMRDVREREKEKS